MPSIKSLVSAACILLLACGSESSSAPKPPGTFTVFPNLPLPPGAEFVSRAGSADALQLTLFSAGETAGVVDYYRGVLSKGRWRLVSDVKKPDGTVVLYAEQDGPPLWVRVWPSSDRPGTMVQLAGAVVPKDSVKAEQGESKPAGS
ncbi:MAG TPA: hypothetical protein VJ808_08265 [Gemmatimonadales bacterium]|nr:hypothetical protein [Gemmatimonadales bacterium]